MLQPAAIVLAAGASTRMGRPKALEPWRGRPFVAHCIGLAAGVGCSPIVVVSGAVPLPDSATDGATVVRTEDWERGQMSSLRVGLAAIGDAAAVLVLTVDRPHIRPDVVASIVDAWRGDPQSIWQPRLGDRRGHPLLYPGDVAQLLVAASPHETQRDVLSRPEVAARRRAVDTDDAAVCDNLDRPEDLARLPS